MALGRETQSLMMMATPRIIVQEEEELPRTDFDSRLDLLTKFPSSLVAWRIRRRQTMWSANACMKPLHPRNRQGLFTRTSRRSGGRREPDAILARYALPLSARPPVQPQPAKYESTWPADAQAIAESLLRTSQLAAIREGLEITARHRLLPTAQGRRDIASRVPRLVSPGQWLVRTTADTAQTVVQVVRRTAAGSLFPGISTRPHAALPLRRISSNHRLT